MKIRNRIKELKHVKASELRHNPKNWRKHPDEQKSAIRGLLEEVGYVGALLVREVEGGYEIVDGHLRAETTPDAEVPVLVLDITAAEASKVLATFDPLSAMAEADPAKLDALLKEIETESEAVAKLLEDLAIENGLKAVDDSPVETKDVKVHLPPRMAWVLIGIPLVKFGEVSALVEQLADVPECVVETTVNDGNAKR